MYALLSAALARSICRTPRSGRGTNSGADFSPARVVRHGSAGVPAKAGAMRRCPGGKGPERKAYLSTSRKIAKTNSLPRMILAREKRGPRGARGSGDAGMMTPARRKKTPKEGEFDGHVA